MRVAREGPESAHSCSPLARAAKEAPHMAHGDSGRHAPYRKLRGRFARKRRGGLEGGRAEAGCGR